MMGAPSTEPSQPLMSPTAQNLTSSSAAYFPPQQIMMSQVQQPLPQYDLQSSMYSQIPITSPDWDDQIGPVPRLPRGHAYYQQQEAQPQPYNIVPQQQAPPEDTRQHVTATIWSDTVMRVGGFQGQKRRYNNDEADFSSHAKRVR